MKAVFLVLVAINALYLGWRLWIVPTSAPPAFVEAQDIPRLKLVGEGVAASPAAEATPAETEVIEPQSVAVPAMPDPVPADSLPQPDPVDQTVSAASVVAQRCVSLGPFVNLREATAAAAKLTELGLQSSQRLSESQVWFGHWVHLPPQPSREAAIAIVEDLRTRGITDIYIEPSGPFENSISLGVFSDAAHAETRAGQIRRMGVSPQIRDRYRDSSVYWVDFSLAAKRELDPADFQASPSRLLRLETRECPQDG